MSFYCNAKKQVVIGEKLVQVPTLIRKVKNELAVDITISVPGNDPYEVVVLQPSVTVDLLTLLSQDELETLQTALRGLVDRGSVSIQGTIASPALEPARVQAQITL